MRAARLPLILCLFLGALTASAAPPPLGQPAPAFTLSMLDGRQLSLADLRGRVVVLNFWHSG